MIDSTTALLEKVLDLRMKAHEVHTSNIANANVPEFKAKKVAFTKALEDAISLADSSVTLREEEAKMREAVAEVGAQVYDDPNAEVKSNGNSVNMETEQTSLAKNTIAYQAAIQLLNKKFAMSRYVLTEGGRK